MTKPTIAVIDGDEIAPNKYRVLGKPYKGEPENNLGFYNSGGKYLCRSGQTKTPACRLWENIKIRCINLSKKERFKTYRDVTICEEWKDFQNFAEWYEQIIKSPYFQVGWELDKDILSTGGNKIYSPETCCFIPSEVNRAIQTSKGKRGEFPIGICKHGNGIQVRYHCIDESFKVDKYFSKEKIKEAFLLYKTAKENYIKTLADKYSDCLDPRVYQYLIKYEVNIDD